MLRNRKKHIRLAFILVCLVSSFELASPAPVITLETKLLQRLEGTYKPRSAVVTFKVKENGLYRVSGTTDEKLNAHSPMEFTSGGRKYTFFLDEKGNSKGVQVLDFSGVYFMPINDRPGEEAGPNKKEWQDFVGEYSYKFRGDTTKASVMIKNGYLYLEGWGGLKLTEYKPGLFFTADGEAVIFQNGSMVLGHNPYLKESGAPSLYTPQSATVQPADKYADKLRVFEEFVRNQMEENKIPGLTIGFYKDDYTWVNGFGYADLENKAPAKAESDYRLASITKTFTSAAILQLAEKGKINRTDDAVALLKVAVELRPKSPILYDSLGNLYAQKGQKELAIQAYQIALEADPAFAHAREMLKKFAP